MRKQKALLKSSTVPCQVNQHFFEVGTPNKNHDMCFFGVGTKVGSWLLRLVEVVLLWGRVKTLLAEQKEKLESLAERLAEKETLGFSFFCFLQGFCWDLRFCIATSNSSNLIIPRVSLTESGKNQEAGTWESIPHMYHSASKGIRQFCCRFVVVGRFPQDIFFGASWKRRLDPWGAPQDLGVHWSSGSSGWKAPSYQVRNLQVCDRRCGPDIFSYDIGRKGLIGSWNIQRSCFLG